MKETSNKLIRVSAWVPKHKLRLLMKEKGKGHNQSEILRTLIDEEAERIASFKAHQKIHGIAKAADFDDRLL